VLLLSRILFYQTVGYEKYRDKVLNRITTEAEVIAERGKIYDRNGVLLATSTTTYRVFIAPRIVAQVSEEQNLKYDVLIATELAPILEVDAAARAGLGVLGLNGLLITPDYGSFVFLAELITDADYEAVTGTPAPAFPTEPPRCEGCGACARACPMGCREGDRALCLSALTQKKGELTPAEAAAIREGGLLWGCDACQLACPHNRRVIRAGRDTPLPYFTEDRLPRLTGDVLSAMPDEAFRSRAYSWRGRPVIARNLRIFED
jgi:epoxyqueuosine reductase QueG